MPYLGNIPPSEFRTIDYQDFTGVTGNPVKRGFTLTSPVSNANDLEIFVNNVRQEPGVAYTVSGTALTMTGDVETTDDFYVVYQGKAVASVVPTDGSVSTAKIADDAVTSAKLDTNIEVSGILTEPNKEYFQVDLTTTQSGIVDGTTATVDFNTNGTVRYDTKSNFDASTNSYELDSSDGVYWVEYSLAVTSDTANTPEIVSTSTTAEFSTDNFSSIAYEISEFTRHQNVADALTVTDHHKRSTIFKATSSGTKIRIRGQCNVTGNNTNTVRFAHNAATQGGQFDGMVTSLTVVRIA